MNSKKIGLYLGTFDPFHKGHYFSIENSLNLVNEIIIQPHNQKKQPKHISLEHRLNMCKLGSSNLKRVRIRDEKRNVYDLRKDGKYRFQLVKWVEEEIGQAPTIIMGADKLNGDMYKDPKSELLKFPHIIFLRQETQTKSILDIKNHFKEVYILKEIGTISSSNIRRLIKRGTDVSNFLPENVLRYIQENKLYI